MATSWLICGATVVSDGVARITDVKITGDRIAAVGDDLNAQGATVIDAAGKVLLPGLIDDQVHFREPGLVHKACIASESAAAVTGGVTSYLEMPNTIPPTVDNTALAAKFAIAEDQSRANYGFYLGATGTNNDYVRQAAQLGACGIKVFLGSSTGDLLVDDQAALEGIFAAVPQGMVLAAHCEDEGRIRQRQKQFVAQGGGDVAMAMHPVIRDAKACYASTKRAIDLAHRNDTRLHVLHLTTAAELDLFEDGPVDKKLITAEACVHHLWFTDADYARLGGRIKCNPAIKTQADRDALRAALRTNQIDVVATDHAPHLLTEKQGPYLQVCAGLPLVGHSLLILLELVSEGVLELSDIARLGAHNPARLFGILDRGFIRAGYYADLVLVDLAKTTTAADAQVGYRCGWTPYAGHTFCAAIDTVWISGLLAVQNQRLIDYCARAEVGFC